MIVSGPQRIEIETRGRGYSEIGPALNRWLSEHGCGNGLLNVFCRHTSASLIICENADPDVLDDLERWMSGLVTDGDGRFRHRAEGDDDMAAHIRSVLTTTSLSIPVVEGELDVGVWQGVFVWEHRYRPHRRQLSLSFVGEAAAT